MTDFTIVIPTVKTNLLHHTNQLLSKLDLPFNFIILNGSEGKPQTLNKYKLNPIPTKYTLFLDDDMLLPDNALSQLKYAMEVLPRPGVISFHYETAEGHAYMMVNNLEKLIITPQISYREAININIAGGIHCIKTEHLKNTLIDTSNGIKYRYDDDGITCMKLKSIGLKNYYIKDKNGIGPTILHYKDTEEYTQMKNESLKKTRGY